MFNFCIFWIEDKLAKFGAFYHQYQKHCGLPKFVHFLCKFSIENGEYLKTTGLEPSSNLEIESFDDKSLNMKIICMQIAKY